MTAQPSRNDEDNGCLWIVGAVMLLLVYGSVCALWQDGWRMLGSFWLSYFVLALAIIGVVAIASEVRSGPIRGLSLLGLGGVIFWIRYAAPFASRWNALTDLSALAVACVLATLLVRRLGRRAERRAPAESARKASTPDYELYWFVFAVGITGLLVSVFTLAGSPSLPTDARRFARLGPARSIVPAEARRWEGLRIGLALSGGGYRAALFHAGALEALEDLGLRVDGLSTVSGGSIIGAYYTVGGAPKDFVAAVRGGRFALKRELLLPHNALRLLAPLRLPGSGVELLPFGEFDRLDVQTRLLDRLLFRDAELQAGLRQDEPAAGQPRLLIAATDLTYGLQVGLLPDGMLRLGAGLERQQVYRGAAFHTEEPLSLAERVAISGAFPVAFPPRPWPVQVVPAGAKETRMRQLLLADGGVRDNTGLDLLRAAARLARAAPTGDADHALPAEWKLDAILASDGGAVLGVLDEPGGPLSLLPRAFDVAAIDAEGRPLPPEGCASILDRPLGFSPGQLSIDPDGQFDRKGKDGDPAALTLPWKVELDPSKYPEPVLRRLVEILPAAKRPAARSALAVLLKGQSGGAKLDPDAALAFQQAIAAPVLADLEIFRQASTLDDRPPKETVDALERLGKALVYLRWPELVQRLDEAVRCKAGGLSPFPRDAALPEHQ